MAMVISPRSKIVTLALLIGIIILAALIILGVIGVWHRNEKTSNNNNAGTKVMSSKLQQITGYAAMQHQNHKIENHGKSVREPTFQPAPARPEPDPPVLHLRLPHPPDLHPRIYLLHKPASSGPASVVQPQSPPELKQKRIFAD